MNRYANIYEVVKTIPVGKVMTYGQIARALGGYGARQVGYAMAALRGEGREHVHVPWQRVINSKGEISRRRRGDGHVVQRRLLESEGVAFQQDGRIDLAVYRHDIRHREDPHGLRRQDNLNDIRPRGNRQGLRRRETLPRRRRDHRPDLAP